MLVPCLDLLATASVGESWRWDLRIDSLGLFRWYLDGSIETNLRATTMSQAKSALRGFVERTLCGELTITEVAD